MTDSRTSEIDVAEFGPNVWLVDEMYHRFLDDPGSVSEAWQEFFEDYSPHFPPGAGAPSPGTSGVGGPPTSRPSAGRDLPPLRGGQTGEPAAGRDLPPAPTGVGGPPTPPPAAVGAPSPSLRLGDKGEAAAGAPSPSLRPGDKGAEALKGIPAAIARRMDESLTVPTATSVRTIPAKLLEVNRRIVNNQLARLTTGGKVSFTHLIGWGIVRALRDLPDLNVAYAEIDGAPHVIRHPHVNLGLAIDLERPDGSRVLLVPNLRDADTLDFERFWLAYEDLIRKARTNRLVPDDFAGTTVTLTNPGTIGTVQSVPRLMPDQGVIVGVGAIQYPPEFQAADARYLARQGIGRVVTLTSTYDHRVIQGAQSGELLARIHALLLGEDGFYDEVFEALGVPYTPARWAVDDNPPIGSPAWSEKQANVFRIANAYRVRGHLIADLDPLRQQRPTLYAELDPLFYGLTIWDLDREFATGGLGGQATMPLGDILARLRDAYCRTTGVEFMHIQETAQKQWLQERLELPPDEVTHDERLRILRKLNQAEAFEKFLHTKYVGHKRFGLEGSESMIPLLDALLGAAVGDGIEEVVFGMAHRGRLNVLVNVMGKSFAKIFREFEGDLDVEATGGSGDVKYHLGTTGTYDSEAGEVEVHLVANPSHLEAVNPVLEGVARAKQERRGQDGHHFVLPVLIHGDAAFAGQGVVVETLHLSQLRGYRTGGTVHVVINNQVGFTTSALDARSSFYATDVAKTVQAPIIHVNGDDPEAVIRAARLAFAFRQAFHKDVVIDLIAYRRRGHNEGDEPSYTQPLMYKLIEERRSVRKLYLERLVNTGEISMEDGEALLEEFRGLMEQAFSETRDSAARTAPDVPVAPEAPAPPVTAAARQALDPVIEAITTPPPGFTLHPKLERLVEERARMLDSGGVDWAVAEALAIGTLARQGVPVRLTGEDSRRGTFSHRHALYVDYVTGEEWAPLRTLSEARVRVVDSLLSEFAAVGFEYGYSVEWPEALVMWEAQFGDFANGAQVIVDNFLASGEAKWAQQSGLTLLLPHGYEGQGPEHSSGRIERFLELCAQDNLRVVVPSTTGQYFHLLRRQALIRPRKPLIVFTPKSLLRSRESFSPVRVLTEGRFQPVLEDPEAPAEVRRLVLCTGKVAYDLLRRRAEANAEGVLVVRVAQLYPFADEELHELASRHPDAELVWAQEEPENMGAYRFLWHRLRAVFGKEPIYAGRPAAPSPATGSSKLHQSQQAALVDLALGI